MRYILALSLILSSFEGHAAYSDGSPLGRTAAVFTADSRHPVIEKASSRTMSLHPAATGFGRSTDFYANILPEFLGEACNGGQILDLGCGRAGHIMPIFNSRKAPVHYTAVDLDSTEAKTKFEGAPPAKSLAEDHSTLSFVSADAIAHLKTLASDSVDTILSTHLIHFFEPAQLVEFFRETHRVLKPGKKLYLTWADFYCLGLPNAAEVNAKYESRQGTMRWPGMLDIIPVAALNSYTTEHLVAKPTFEGDVAAAIEAILPGSPKAAYTDPTARIIRSLRQKASSSFFFNILKPIEMKSLAEDLGFTVRRDACVHYMDHHSDGGSNTYYGLILTKSGDINMPFIEARLADAQAKNFPLLESLKAKAAEISVLQYVRKLLANELSPSQQATGTSGPKKK